MGQNRHKIEHFEANIEGFLGTFGTVCTVFLGKKIFVGYCGERLC
jgi:hypothetical protein